MNNRIMIVAGEASGDLHGANLVKSLKALKPQLTFSGIGGIELEKAGVELLYDAAKISVVGFFEVISHLKEILEAQTVLRKNLTQNRPDLLILIDFPDFNFLLARKAKKLGIPIFYYISPQVWAWRSGRVKTIARLVDKIGVILPFEETYYRDRGVDAYYVGHPLLDTVSASKSRDQYRDENEIDEEKLLLGVLPGSRLKEVRRLLPVFLEAALRFSERSNQKPVILVPKAPTINKSDLMDNGVTAFSERLDIKIVSGDRYNMMASCDAVIAASGTVTLELLLLKTPMVVAYKLSTLTYYLGKLLVKVDYFSLVNLIARKEVVPELLQDEANADRISKELYELVFNKSRKERLAEDFKSINALLGSRGASVRAAKLAESLLEK